MTQSLAERFRERFSGLERAYGTYNIKSKAPANGSKHLGAAQTVRAKLTLENWRNHLDGVEGLGIVPIRDDSTVRFGAIDVDAYKGLDHKELARKAEEAELPLIVCRSKSGGAHLYLFCREDTPAELVRGRLMEWSVILGHSGVEIFPKQIRLASSNDVGNWINMPYFKASKTDRWAIFDGKKLSAEDFLSVASQIAVTVSQLEDLEAKSQTSSDDDLLYKGPPCLQSLARSGGIQKGHRNNGLFNLGVYLRKRYGEGAWEEHLDKYNQAYLKPPLGHKEVSMIVRSVNRKAYEYKCKDQPICDVCSVQICRSREYGVGQGEGDPGVVFGQLVKLETDPPTWIWDVDGARIELTTAELKDQGRFHTRAIEELNKWPSIVKPQQWATLVREHLSNCEVQEVPEDARPEGQAFYYLQQYCIGQARARSKDEILQNKPWTDREAGRVFFHGPHFHQYLVKQGIRVPPRTLWMWLRNRGAETSFFNLKGRGINVWSVPAFPEQTEAFDVPNIEDEEEM